MLVAPAWPAGGPASCAAIGEEEGSDCSGHEDSEGESQVKPPAA